MPTVADTAKLLRLKQQIESMSPGDRLRFAAMCIDKKEYAIAETIAGNVVDELSALRVLSRK